MLAAVDELRDDLVELLQALIRIPTLNPPGEAYEDFVIEFRARLDAYGYTTEVHDVPEADLPALAPFGEGLPRPNLLATLNRGDGPVVHLGRVAVAVQPGAVLDDEVLVGLAGRVERRDADQRLQQLDEVVPQLVDGRQYDVLATHTPGLPGGRRRNQLDAPLQR